MPINVPAAISCLLFIYVFLLRSIVNLPLYITKVIAANTAKGSRITHILKKRSGPKREALICAAVFELHNGHAADVAENITKIIKNTNLIFRTKDIQLVFQLLC